MTQSFAFVKILLGKSLIMIIIIIIIIIIKFINNS